MSHFGDSIGPSGPILNVIITASEPRRLALEKAMQPIPMPMSARLLIDTGASQTSVDNRILSALNLSPTGQVAMLTPSTGTTSVSMSTYDVQLVFGGLNGAVHNFRSMAVIGCDFSAQGIDGLFGRDAMEQARFVYSGPDSTYMLSF